METKKAIIILVFAVVTSFILTNVIYDYLTIVDSKELKMYLTVADYAGFDVNTSALIFGTVPKGGSSSREVILTNDFNIPLKVDLKAYGELAGWVHVFENGFLMQPNVVKTVKVSATIPENAKFGNYAGILKISFQKG